MMRQIISRYPALGYPYYRRFWFASFASVGATQLITMGQGWLIYELTGSALQLGWLGVAAALPNILMTLIGGVIADRFDKRIILLLTSSSVALLLSILAWLDYQNSVQVWHVLTIAALFSLITGLDWPVRVAIFPQLIEREAFMSAVALNSFIWQVTRMAIPAAGGLLIAQIDTWIVFALAALGFMTMFAVMLTLHIKRTPRSYGSPKQELLQGLSFVKQHALFAWLFAVTFTGMFFVSSSSQIMPIFAELVGGGETAFGLLLGAGGMGSIVGTLLVGAVSHHPRLGDIMLGSAALSALTAIAFSWIAAEGWYFAALLAMFVTSAFASVYLISSMTVLQLSVPDQVRGRVMGIHSICFSLAPLGGLFLGTTAEWSSAAWALTLGSVVYLGVLLLTIQQQPFIRRLKPADIEVLRL